MSWSRSGTGQPQQQEFGRWFLNNVAAAAFRLQVTLNAARARAAFATTSPAAGAPAAASPSLVQLGAESFLSGTSSVYAEEMYRAWKADPSRCAALQVESCWAGWRAGGVVCGAGVPALAVLGAFTSGGALCSTEDTRRRFFMAGCC
jgi:hypothetical protein